MCQREPMQHPGFAVAVSTLAPKAQRCLSAVDGAIGLAQAAEHVGQGAQGPRLRHRIAGVTVQSAGLLEAAARLDPARA